ncbi:MAG: YcgN family cysteine cluster protein [Pseudomonadota bacterium]
MSTDTPFWETTALDALTADQWESLCDGCARCCLHKLQDEDTQAVYYTDVACTMLDVTACRCTDYDRRHERMPACARLTCETVRAIGWLPATCAYRLCALGKPLPRWHHLLTGSMDGVHRSGASVRGKAVVLEDPDEETLMARVVEMIATDTGLRLFLPSEGDSP